LRPSSTACAGRLLRASRFPAYPQILRRGRRQRVRRRVACLDWPAPAGLPGLRFVNRYHDDPGYIDALAASAQHWQREGRGRSSC
jgi:protoheme ferro-lyase